MSCTKDTYSACHASAADPRRRGGGGGVCGGGRDMVNTLGGLRDGCSSIHTRSPRLTGGCRVIIRAEVDHDRVTSGRRRRKGPRPIRVREVRRKGVRVQPSHGPERDWGGRRHRWVEPAGCVASIGFSPPLTPAPRCEHAVGAEAPERLGQAQLPARGERDVVVEGRVAADGRRADARPAVVQVARCDRVPDELEAPRRGRRWGRDLQPAGSRGVPPGRQEGGALESQRSRLRQFEIH